MDKLIIQGGRPLKGAIRISGAKNAALPLMCAALLTDGKLVLENVPDLADIKTLAEVLEVLGASVNRKKVPDQHVMSLQAPDINNVMAPYDLVRKMRASVLVLGPLLARCGVAEISLPGGCAIGNRPIDLHLKGLEAMGAKITLHDGYVRAEAPKGGLLGAAIEFPTVSVGATENLLMAASLAKGKTILKNAAREPEISDLAHCLNAMGANITGIGTGELVIEGVQKLSGATYTVMPDRIETGSYAIAAAITGGDVILENTDAKLLGGVFDAMLDAGITLEAHNGGLRVHNGRGRPRPLKIRTEPFPGFATDMQAQMMALLALADGTSEIEETIFENRFMHVPELTRMGADIETHGGKAVIRGVERLIGAPVMATDLRASMCLIIAGLAAEGETVLSRVYHLDRGYEHLAQKLSGAGASIRRVSA